MIEFDSKMDALTELPNFMRFFTDDFHQVYGEYGCILYFKIKPLRVMNKKYGRHIGDEVFRQFGVYLNEQVEETYYRSEGNGFSIIYKEADDRKAKIHCEALRRLAMKHFKKTGAEEGFFFSMIMPYTEPIRSIADYYLLFHDVYMKEFNAADSKELMHHLLQKLSYRVNDAIGNYHEVRAFALHDDISDLQNAKHAMIYLNHLKKGQHTYALLFLDGDSLSRFNEISYDFGNQVIRSIGTTLKHHMRGQDRVFRWLSGDEFLVVVNDVSLEEAYDIAERLRIAIPENCLSYEKPVTVSVGVAHCPTDGTKVDDILTKTELANKAAKNAGKNCTFLYKEIKTE